MPQVEAKESKVLISVIIPVYNVRTFLPELFENLKGQNLTHTEVLFIDDGSADGSSEELDRLAKGTDFIVIHQENSGVAAARNHALDIAHGEYLCFIDPDDRISINYLQVLKQVAHDNHPDLIITDWRKVVNGVQQPLYLAPIDFPQFPTTQLVLTEILSSGRIIGSLWAKLFSAKLFRIIVFRYSGPALIMPRFSAPFAKHTIYVMPPASFMHTQPIVRRVCKIIRNPRTFATPLKYMKKPHSSFAKNIPHLQICSELICSTVLNRRAYTYAAHAQLKATSVKLFSGAIVNQSCMI